MVPLKPLRLVTVILVETSSSQSVLLPSQSLDSPPTVNEVWRAEIVKSGVPETWVTTKVWDALWDRAGEDESVTVSMTVKEPAVE